MIICQTMLRLLRMRLMILKNYMAVAKEENATKTYAKLKDEYLSLKAILNVLGVNLTDIDKIKE